MGAWSKALRENGFPSVQFVTAVFNRSWVTSKCYQKKFYPVLANTEVRYLLASQRKQIYIAKKPFGNLSLVSARSTNTKPKRTQHTQTKPSIRSPLVLPPLLASLISRTHSSCSVWMKMGRPTCCDSAKCTTRNGSKSCTVLFLPEGLSWRVGISGTSGAPLETPGHPRRERRFHCGAGDGASEVFLAVPYWPARVRKLDCYCVFFVVIVIVIVIVIYCYLLLFYVLLAYGVSERNSHLHRDCMHMSL
jgi:hypothetical protein